VEVAAIDADFCLGRGIGKKNYHGWYSAMNTKDPLVTRLSTTALSQKNIEIAAGS